MQMRNNLHHSTRKSWISAYIYFRGSIYDASCDRVVREVVTPFVDACRERDWIDRFFFIRYRTHGPHIRLRLLGAPQILGQDVKPALISHVQSTLPEEVRVASAMSGNGEAHRPVQWIPYEPEIHRYGGRRGVELAEEYFCGSSTAAVAMLQQLDKDDSAGRLGKGIMAMLVLIGAFYPEREKATVFARNYARNYLRMLANADGARDVVLRNAFEQGYEQNAGALAAYVEAAWERVHNRESLSATLDHYRIVCEDLREEFERLLRNGLLMKGDQLLNDLGHSIALILPSYIHMMNNRLGIPWHEEAYLGHVLSQALMNTKEQVLI